MYRKLLNAFIVAALLSSLVAALPLGASAPVEKPAAGRVPPRLREIPPELAAEFENGLSVEEFIARNRGRVPHALEQATQAETMIVVELDQAPLLAYMAEKKAQGRTVAALAQRSYERDLLGIQASVAPRLEALNVRIISRYTKVYNGFLVRAPANRLDAIRSLPHVKAVHRAPAYHLDLGASVPLIGSKMVWQDLGFDGDGVNIAIVDSGIDYTHAALGGSGDPADYASNDRDTIETGTFPTAKVIGGWDFAGANYDASSDVVTNTIPVPDPDPLDYDGHGTHVASIAAGVAAGQVMTGVAPLAKLYALKVFGEPAGSTNLVPDALEWIATLNLSTTVPAENKIHVVNMSLGSDYGPALPGDPELVAIKNLTDMGVVVVASAGNAGDTPYITGSPAVADSAISVAASTTGYATMPTLEISGTTVPTLTNIMYQVSAFASASGHYSVAVTAPLAYVGAYAASDLLCATDGVTPTSALRGTVALIQRGECAFSVKVANAAALGAVGAIIFNHKAGGNALVTMAGDGDIPAAFIARADGLNLKTANGQTVIVHAESDVRFLPDPYIPADTIADFSSRGPRGLDSKLKPDITAPGVAIFAAAVGTGDEGVSLGGTSMAAPHVAGVAALMKQAHPAWTVEQIKAAMMNTAVDLADDTLIPRAGAGRIDAYAAASSKLVAVADEDLVSANWGLVITSHATKVLTKTITLYSWDTVAHTLDAAAVFQTGSITDGLTFEFNPATVQIPAAPMSGSVVLGASQATVAVTLTLDSAKINPGEPGSLDEVYGYITFADQVTGGLRLPFYLLPRPYTTLELAGENTITNPARDYVTLDITQTGPISSSLWIYPLLVTDSNEITNTDSADVRAIGMDYGWHSNTYGDIFVVAINTHGYWHTPQPYFVEFDLYLDTNEDGAPDFVLWNSNYGWLTGGSDTDTWIIAQYDIAAGEIYLASPYLITTDYNNGIMEWPLPATWNGLEDIAPAANTSFDFWLYGYDMWGQRDDTTPGSFDLAKPPFVWGGMEGSLLLPLALPNPGPAMRHVNAFVAVDSLAGYNYSQPKGVLVVDYNGDPRNANGKYQAYTWSINVTLAHAIYLPVVMKNH